VARGLGGVVGRGLPDAGFALCDFLLTPCVAAGRYRDPIVGMAWTLRYEAYFYGATALAVLTGWRHLPVLLIGLLVCLKPAGLEYYAEPICLEFIAGYLLAMCIPLLQRHPWPKAWAWCFVLLVMALFIWSATGQDFPLHGPDLTHIPRMMIYHADGTVWPRFIAWGVPAVLLTLAFVGIEPWVPAVAIRLGQVTYSMYLLQHFFLPATAKLARHGWPDELAVLAIVAMLLLASQLSFQYLEHPVNSWWRQKVKAQR